MSGEIKDLHHLFHIKDAIADIQEFMENISIEQFASNKLLQAGVIRNFEIIGEASSKISEEIKKDFQTVDWTLLKDFRNVLAHEYYRIDIGEVWATINHDLPPLKENILAMIKFFETE